MRVLIAAGGSGGHIFPAIALARELKKENADIIFVASKRRLDRTITRELPYKKVFMSVNPMPYRVDFRIVNFVVKAIYDLVLSAVTIVRFRPKVVVGFGGYTAGAVVLFSVLCRIKTVIHEQNIVPGRTNKLLGALASKVALSFTESGKYFKKNNTVYTGLPLRAECIIKNSAGARSGFGLEKNKFTILIMGGSQGAVSLNALASSGIALLSREEKTNLQVIHITGRSEENNTREIYEKAGVKNVLVPFIDSISDAYSACDMAISRAGASALFELVALEKPMILVPYPSVKNNQRFNALFFAGHGAAIYEDEKTTAPGDLRDDVKKLFSDEALRKRLSENARKLIVTDGAKRLKEVILNLKK